MSLSVCAAALFEMLDAGERGGWEPGAQTGRPDRCEARRCEQPISAAG